VNVIEALTALAVLFSFIYLVWALLRAEEF
jgi:hypothetical protein